MAQGCVQRLQREFKALCKEPVPQILARPSPTNILEWHFILEGSEGTPFEGGVYHGKLRFSPEYPYKPPSISMITPNGRFASNQSICMSMSNYHPETWNPSCSVSTILIGLLSFMVDSTFTTGSVFTTKKKKRTLAKGSLAYNAKSAVFQDMFPDYMEKLAEKQRATEMEAERSQELREPVGLSGELGPQHESVVKANGAEVEVMDGTKQKQPRRFSTWLTALKIGGCFGKHNG